MARFLVALSLALTTAASAPNDIPLEYQVKAAYLFNFTRFVEWPSTAFADGGAFTICVAGRNPFGTALSATIAGESVAGRTMISRVVHDARLPCHVLFVPRGVPAAPYLRQVRSAGVLTVGEAGDFLDRGGVVKFVLDNGRVRFDINRDAAARGQLTISSRLLRLARRIEPADAK